MRSVQLRQNLLAMLPACKEQAAFQSQSHTRAANGTQPGPGLVLGTRKPTYVWRPQGLPPRYVPRPIAVAVRKALFTSSGLTNLTSIGVQSLLQCTASLCLASLGLTLPSWIVSTGMRLLRLAHSIWDHSVLVLCFSGLCLRAPGRGSLASVAGLPWSLLFYVDF